MSSWPDVRFMYINVFCFSGGFKTWMEEVAVQLPDSHAQEKMQKWWWLKENETLEIWRANELLSADLAWWSTHFNNNIEGGQEAESVDGSRDLDLEYEDNYESSDKLKEECGAKESNVTDAKALAIGRPWVAVKVMWIRSYPSLTKSISKRRSWVILTICLLVHVKPQSAYPGTCK